jgi:hypothetical protein
MEDLFPSKPEPPTSEDARQSEDESEDWLIEWDKKFSTDMSFLTLHSFDNDVLL